MKNSLLTVLIIFLVLPAFTPWFPHGTIHALHDHQTKHHGEKNYSHKHEDHTRQLKSDNKQTVHHPIHFNVATYFNDYLHIDLHSSKKDVLKTPVPDTYEFDYSLVAVINLTPRYELTSVQNRAPPDKRRLRKNNLPLYLSTQRLRI